MTEKYVINYIHVTLNSKTKKYETNKGTYNS